MVGRFDLQRLKYETIFRCISPLVKIRAPRGGEWVDSLVSSLELDKPHGVWEKKGINKSPLWNSFLSIAQEVYASRRDNASSLSEKWQWNRILTEIELAQRMPNVRAFPRRGYVEVTKDCNLRCPMCPQGYEELNRGALPTSALSHLEKIIPYFELVELFGFGDPLSSPHFSDWIRKWPRIENQTVTMTTNGLLLTDSLIENILSSSLNQIRISADAVTPETYKLMRGVNALDRLIENIRHLVNERNRKRNPLNIWMKMVATRMNIHELPDFVRLAHKLGVDYVEVMFLCAYTPDMWQQSLVYDRTLCNRMFAEAERVARELKIAIHVPAYFDLSLKPSQMDKGEFQESCREPWEFIYMTNDQTVRACCINMTTTGDFKQNTFDEIWNGVGYQKFRRQLAGDNKQYRCRFCYLNYLYADVNNIRSHLIDLKPHFNEVGLGNRLNLPNHSNLETVISDFLKGDTR